jgi:hypothetical protein
MKKLILLIFVITFNNLSAQHIYKNRKFFGGSFYINNQTLKDVTFGGSNTNSNGDEYWNNTPYDKDQPKDIETNTRMRFDMRYGWFPADMFAIGGDFEITSNSYNEENSLADSAVIWNTFMQNKSRDITIGPFARWYMFEVGGQPYEIGAVFLEGAYQFGIGSSTEEFEFSENDSSFFFHRKEEYGYIMTKATAKLGFSMYLSDFISHNWFTGFLIALEPSIQYDWITRSDMVNYNDFDTEQTGERIRNYNGLKFNISLVSYF